MFPTQWRIINHRNILRDYLNSIIMNAQALKSFADHNYISPNSDSLWTLTLNFAGYINLCFKNSDSDSIYSKLYELYDKRNYELLSSEIFHYWDEIIAHCQKLLDALNV